MGGHRSRVCVHIFRTLGQPLLGEKIQEAMRMEEFSGGYEKHRISTIVPLQPPRAGHALHSDQHKEVKPHKLDK